MKNALLTFCALCAGLGFAAGEKPYRVATLPTWKNHGHNVQWNYIYKEAGWSYTNLLEKAEAMDWLKDHLDEFDMLIGTQLFGYNAGDRAMPYDMKKYAKAIGEWVKKGGCIYLMDCNYGGRSLDWFKEIDPALECGSGRPQCNNFGPAVGTEPLDPLLFFPNAAEYGFTWNHMTVPDQQNTAWKILARCQHGEPTLMACRWGKGIILLNSCSNYVREFLQNLKANRLFLSMGLAITSARAPSPLPGPNTYEIFCENLSDEPKRGTLTLRLTPVLEKDAKGKVVKTGTPVEYAGASTIAAKSAGAFTLSCAVKERGECRAELILSVAGASGSCFDKTVVLPELFTLAGTRYRNLLTTTRRFTDIAFKTSLWPADDGARTNFTVKVTLRNGKGGKVAESRAATLARGDGETTLKIPRSLGEGVYAAEAELFEDGKPVAKSSASVEIVGDVPGAAFYDEDATMLVDGEPYLPLGIYHVPREDWARVADVGFNIVNVFSWMGTSALNALRELDVKTLWEQLPHRSPDACRAQGTELQGNPAALLWYTVDEPSEESFPFVKRLDDAWHGADKFHPTFIVSYQPHHFTRNAKLSDILAPDNYPYSAAKGDDSNVWSVSKTCDRAVAASQGKGPVIFVPQAFGHEPPEVWRNMSFQALCHGAKGLIWYAWRENDKVGLKYNPTLVAEVATTIAELKALAPAILNGVDRARGFTAADGQLQGLVMTDPNTGAKYLMLANSLKTPLSCEIELPELAADVTAISGGRYGTLACADGKVRVELPKFGSGVYALAGELPKPVALNTAWINRELPARASGKTLYVATNGVVKVEKKGFFSSGTAKAYTDLQAALDAAEDGDVIKVSEGVYGPVVCDNKLVDVLATGAAGKTVIDARWKERALTLTLRPFGDMSRERNCRFVGFTVRNGQPRKGEARPALGGAVLGGTLVNCVVERSSARFGGGAAYARLENCRVSNNRAKDGGAVAMCESTECLFEGNTAEYDGGAAHFGASTRCVMSGNRAGRDGGAAHFGTVTSCRLVYNRANRDGGAANRARLVSTFVSKNSAGHEGGGVYGGQSLHCTIADNASVGPGAAANASVHGGWGVDKRIERSVVLRNVSKSEPKANSVTNLSASAVWTDCATKTRGFVTNEMKLVAKDNFVPAAGSPLVDASDTYFERGARDASGRARIAGAGADIGAFERFSGDTLFVAADFSRGCSASGFSDANNFAVDQGYRDVFKRVRDGALVFDGDNSKGQGRYAIRTWFGLPGLPNGATLTQRTITFEFSCEKGEGGELMNFAGGPLSVRIDRASGVFRAEVAVGDQKKKVNALFWDGPKVADGRRHTVKLVYDKLNGMSPDVWRVWVDGAEIAVRNELKKEARYLTYDNGLVFGGRDAKNPFVGKLYKFEYRGER